MSQLFVILLFAILQLTSAIIPTQGEIDAISQVIRELIDNGADPADLVRLAWHDAATFNHSFPAMMSGGNHANMRLDFSPKEVGDNKTNSFEGGDLNNAGQNEAFEELDVIRQQFKNIISVADLWVLAANTAIEHAGGPHITTRFGRLDDELPEDGIETFPGGPLPDAEQNADSLTDERDDRELNELEYLLDFFGKFGFDDTKNALAALVGGHTLGKCEVQNSGYDGPWTLTAKTFNNKFYQLLVNEEFTEHVRDNDDNAPFGVQHQLDLLDDEEEKGNTLMLYSDVAILRDTDMVAFAKLYANDQDAWFKDFAKYWGELMELAWKGRLVEAQSDTPTDSTNIDSSKVQGKSLGIGFAIGFVVMALIGLIYVLACNKKAKEDDNYTAMDEQSRKGSELARVVAS